MTRKIERTYSFSESDIRNALSEWLSRRSIPAPKYLGDTPCTSWTYGADGSQTVKWVVEDEPVF